MKFSIVAMTVCLFCLLIAEACDIVTDGVRDKQIFEQQEQIKKLTDKVTKMDALLNKMAKGLGYDGPEFWQ